MILAIDIGNTTTSFGLFRGGRLARRFDLPTILHASSTELRRRLKARLAGARVERAIICSVVPKMTRVLPGILRALGIRRVALVGRDVRVPLRNRYRYPKQVGQDRLVGAYAAWSALGRGAPRGRPAGRSPERARQRESRDCIVCDFGTAITIDLVTKAGEYLGGLIAPGMEISLEALATRTALLPKVALKQPPELLGRDTANSIRSGILYGCAALCDGLVTQLKRRHAPKALVVATGGASSLVSRHARQIDVVRPNLVLEGLFRLSQLQKYSILYGIIYLTNHIQSCRMPPR